MPEGEKTDKGVGKSESTSLNEKLTAIENGSVQETESQSEVSKTTDTTPQSPVIKPWLNESPKKSNKKKWIILSIVALLIIVFGGGAAVYALWYQKPEKVVYDAVSGLLSAKTMESTGKYSVNAEDTKLDGTFTVLGGYKEGSSFDTKATLEGPEKLKLQLDMAIVGAPNGDAYFKLAKLQELYDAVVGLVVGQMVDGETMTEDQQAQVQDYLDETFGPIITKLDNKWVKIAVEDFKKLDKEAGDSYACNQKVYETLSSDTSKVNEIRDVYLANQFIKITQELGEKDGAIGYRIEHDDAKWKQFIEGVEKTWVFKELEKCNDGDAAIEDFKSATEDLNKDDDTTSTFRIWVGKWDHKLKSMEFQATNGKGDDQTKVDVSADFKIDESVKVEIPQNVTPITEIIPSVNEFLSA